VKQGALFCNGTCILPRVARTTNAWDRLRGLLGRPRLQTGEALLIDPCPSVHTIGMSYPLDLVFLDADFRLLKQVSNLKPLRWAACTDARATLELAPGSLESLSLSTGDRFEWRPA
jgi:uncharacterized membrane protein (UPF0127 family)